MKKQFKKNYSGFVDCCNGLKCVYNPADFGGKHFR